VFAVRVFRAIPTHALRLHTLGELTNLISAASAAAAAAAASATPAPSAAATPAAAAAATPAAAAAAAPAAAAAAAAVRLLVALGQLIQPLRYLLVGVLQDVHEPKRLLKDEQQR